MAHLLGGLRRNETRSPKARMLSMRKHYAIFLAVPFLLALLPRHSVYNAPTGVLYCNTAVGCRHEIGHKIDDDLGYPSKSAEFGNAVMVHLAFALQYQMDAAAIKILTQDGMLTYSDKFSPLGMAWFSSPQEELYARIYETSGGDVAQIPPALRPFYSGDEKYIDLYDCLMSASFKICGRALHVEK